jgi:hypothetical protein
LLETELDIEVDGIAASQTWVIPLPFNDSICLSLMRPKDKPSEDGALF